MLFHTARLAGRLDLLPRLFALIQRERASAAGPVFLVDLGDFCAPAVPECAATEGRAVLFVLDAMGYDGVCLSDGDCRPMTSAAPSKVSDNLRMAVCGPADVCGGLPAGFVCERGGLSVACQAGRAAEPAPGAHLVVRRSDGAEGPPRLEIVTRTLWLPPPTEGILGRSEVRFAAGVPAAFDSRALSLPPDMPPDATIAATVDFVREEARLHRHMQRKGGAYEAD